LEIIKQLQEKKIIPIQRANMKLKLTVPSKEGKRLKDRIHALLSNIEDEEWDDTYQVVHLFRRMINFSLGMFHRSREFPSDQ
jgi:ribosome maturation protein SDO1